MTINYHYLPFVTLIIPMKNESLYIENCLHSLILQDYPKDRFEVLVYDGKSIDKSWELASSYEKLFTHFSIFSNEEITQSAAWNAGIKISKGEIVGIISAHSELAEDYISKSVETLLRTNAALVGGPPSTEARIGGKIASAVAIALNSPFGVGGASFHYTDKEIETDSVYMGVCRKKLYYEIGGFDEEMVHNQDDEFSYRVREKGGLIICNPEIKSKYFSRSSFSGLWKQFFTFGYYKVRVLQKHPSQMRLRQFVPGIFVFSLFTSFILSLFTIWAKSLIFVIIGSYITANLIASIFLSKKNGWFLLPLLPIAFFIPHFSYGLGFWVGLIKFKKRWGDKNGKVPFFGQIND
ncbi:MAG: glycosyltransferase family 2 protein [Anaerolineaceae bacterium]